MKEEECRVSISRCGRNWHWWDKFKLVFRNKLLQNGPEPLISQGQEGNHKSQAHFVAQRDEKRRGTLTGLTANKRGRASDTDGSSVGEDNECQRHGDNRGDDAHVCEMNVNEMGID